MLEEKDIKKLEKYGIYNIQQVDTLTTNKFYAKLSKSLEKIFNTYSMESDNLFIKLSGINMFYSDFEEEHVKAKYIPDYKGIFIKPDIDIENLDSSVIHEAIHFLQSSFDEKDNLVSMGLIDGNKHVALNEAATQLIASTSSNEKPSSVTYFDLYFSSPSPNYYPLETAILKQMLFFTGSFPLFHSGLLGNNIFKETFKTITSENVFNYISLELDNLVKYQDNLAKLYQKKLKQNISNFRKKYLDKKITIVKTNIQNTVLNLQDAIYQNCFNNLLNKIESLSDCEDIRAQISNFENILIQKENDFSFNNYVAFANSVIQEKEKQIVLYNAVLNDKFLIEESTYLPIANTPMFFAKNVINKLKLIFDISIKSRILGNES